VPLGKVDLVDIQCVLVDERPDWVLVQGDTTTVMVAALAAQHYRFTAAECWTGITCNAAWALGRGDQIGSLTPGFQADIAIWDMEDYRELPFHFGVNLCDMVIKNGQLDPNFDTDTMKWTKSILKGLAVPADTLDYCVAYGKARVVRPGKDVTVLTYLTGVYDTLAAAHELAEEGLDVEIIDLRTLDYSGLDFETIGESVEKTGRVIIVEQVPRSMGVASRVSDEIQARFYDLLDAPVENITAPDVPPPVSRALETVMLPDLQYIKKRLRAVGTQ